MSHGAKNLYVALRRRVPNGRNRAYLSYRQAEAELKSSQRKIGEWFKELQHYGFIVLAQPGSLGVEGKGKSPHWRLTELGMTSKASADSIFEAPTNDFLKWDRTRFKKQDPASYGGYTLLPTSEALALPTGDTLKNQSASYGVGIGNEEGASYGVGITSLTTPCGSEGDSSQSPNDREKHIRADDPRIVSLVAASCKPKISAEQKERFERVCARFDALPDPRLGVAA
jgi:hypothetical protein